MKPKRTGEIKLAKRLAQVQEVKRQGMAAIANNTVNFFKVTVFNAQGWIDTTVDKWKARKGRAPRNNRKILVDTGAGRQSIHAPMITNTKVIVRAEATYMKFHNEGTGKLPQRKFMGNSRRLDQQNTGILRRFLDKLMK